ncbi:hypothetical protein HJC23_008909 [Cyclotella cryptica]|uniref:Formate/nitrite transporter n=1 Tax=Cyclotella cryptica TaxID=29204 RepID=A0ABD3NQA8_9STRA|eukprot:CCRYP_020322-RA/>CCRYP_020322-RA protein AED:0.09 eAED:0.09 QI:0/-1/0/1/-1/1/1/0/616
MVQYRSSLILLAAVNLSTAFQVPRSNSYIPPNGSLDASVVERDMIFEPVAEHQKTAEVVTPVKYEAASNAVAELDLSKVSNVLTPTEAFEQLVEKGVYNANSKAERLLFSSALGGCYVGMGAMVSLAVAGNSAGLAAADPGLQKFIFAALFPMNLLLAQQCGGMLYTGNTASMMAAVCEKRVTYSDMGRVLVLSWIGNLFGCGLFAIACKYAGVMEGGAGVLAAKTLVAKTSAELGPVLIKAIFCNWLVCLAVVLSTQAKDMGGKYISIWLPVSTFVSIGFEHSVANMFLLPAGLMSQDTITVGDAITKNLIPVTFGNALSGSLLVGATFSYLFGTLGKETSQSAESTAEVKSVKEIITPVVSTMSELLGTLGQGLTELSSASTAARASTNTDEKITVPKVVESTVSEKGLAYAAKPHQGAFFVKSIEEPVIVTEKESMKPIEHNDVEISSDMSYEEIVIEAQREAEEAELKLREAEAEAACLEAELTKLYSSSPLPLVKDEVVSDVDTSLFFEEAEEVEVDLKPVASREVVEAPVASTATATPIKEVDSSAALARAKTAPTASKGSVSVPFSQVASTIPPVSRVTATKFTQLQNTVPTRTTNNLRDLLKANEKWI